jgi:cell division protein FtsW
VKNKGIFKKLFSFFSYYSSDNIDWYLFGSIAFLVIFGLVMLSSAGAPDGFRNFGDSYWHVKHQLIFGFLPGLVCFFFFSRFDHRKLKKLALPLLIFSIVLLVLVFVPGIGSSNDTIARSWLNIFGFSIQPAEIVKLTYLLFLVAWLVGKGEKKIQDLHYGFLPFIFILLVVVGLLMLQPDFGTMSIILFTSLAVYFVAGGRFLHMLWLSLVGVGGLAVMVKISPYRLARLTTFLHPELDPNGIGYHINQALLAVGSGSWLGRGFGHSRQKFAYLPEVAGDSIFAVVAEELGFVISAIVVLVFMFVAIRGFKLANQCKDQFSRLLAIGIITWFLFQAFLNIGAIIGILPLTGVPLPFISFGGTSLTMCLAATGILANISYQNRKG